MCKEKIVKLTSMLSVTIFFVHDFYSTQMNTWEVPLKYLFLRYLALRMVRMEGPGGRTKLSHQKALWFSKEHSYLSIYKKGSKEGANSLIRSLSLGNYASSPQVTSLVSCSPFRCQSLRFMCKPKKRPEFVWANRAR
jgi:hypothetical protein